MKIFSIDKLLSLVFGLVAFVFFAFLYPFHLNYQEQYQLFLFSADYFLKFFSKPGGFSDYIGNFFTQFFFYSWVGAIIVALLLTVLQLIVWRISKLLGAKSFLIPLTFIPSLLYWGLLCDENYLLGGLIVMLLVSCFILVCLFLNSFRSRIAFVLISIPILYWLSGGAFLLLPAFSIAYELVKRKTGIVQVAVFSSVCIILSVAIPVICKLYFLQFPMLRVWIGANYFRFPVNIPFSVGVIVLLIAFVPFLLRFLSFRIQEKSTKLILVIQVVVLLFGGFMFVRQSADMKKEEVMAYDFNVRMRKWDRVIALADKKAPDSPLSVACLNLALAQEGILGERMFCYYQNGIGGLIPEFVRDYTIPMIVGEIYYHLGFVNTAQRYAFEAMEALPDYQKSVRSVKRLAETNLINGDYAVAAKYLNLLQQTFYYRTWATKTMETMKDEKRIAQHPEWGWLRKCRTNEDFLFSEGEKDMMLGILFSQNKENRMAFEYLMTYCLLSKDLQHFIEYFSLGNSLNYKVIPKSFQEALIYIWGLTNNNPTESIPYPVSNVVKQKVQNYNRIYTSQSNAESLLRPEFSDTYWYYLHYRN